jgi:hypothetical protein
MSRHGAQSATDFIPPRSQFHDSGRFGRMFGALPPFASDNPSVRQALIELGKPGGLLDARDKLDASPADLITQPALNKTNANNPAMSAGMTFLGQFIDHDITFDPTSSLERQVDPELIENFRTPTLGLDNLYGSGPTASPHLYDAKNPAKFLIESGGIKADLPRNSQGTALIGDPRNDENLIVSQLHSVMLRFHNRMLEKVAAETTLAGSDLLKETQRRVRWHYQWVVIHDFLRPIYRFNSIQKRVPVFSDDFSPDTRENLNGFRPLPPECGFEWQFYFDIGGNPAGMPVQKAYRIDQQLVNPLGHLPPPVAVDPGVLAQRNLLRGLRLGLPSGQTVARAMHVHPISDADLRVGPHGGTQTPLTDLGSDFKNNAPLWYYVLREAEVFHEGNQLGPVGGRIVAETFIGILSEDKLSYQSVDPAWTPDLANASGRFEMADLIRFALGLPPA